MNGKRQSRMHQQYIDDEPTAATLVDKKNVTTRISTAPANPGKTSTGR